MSEQVTELARLILENERLRKEAMLPQGPVAPFTRWDTKPRTTEHISTLTHTHYCKFCDSTLPCADRHCRYQLQLDKGEHGCVEYEKYMKRLRMALRHKDDTPYLTRDQERRGLKREERRIAP